MTAGYGTPHTGRVNERAKLATDATAIATAIGAAGTEVTTMGAMDAIAPTVEVTIFTMFELQVLSRQEAMDSEQKGDSHTHNKWLEGGTQG